ncbi:aldolase [Salinibacterium hongtaonis]|uniref:Aldolase n=1 Tax=Homoserinimonas hongtaonis TaxID=2079791 RepID=A0A2U1T1D6_9MICO|nr:aldolase [Salinibacterium hongtaonis]
MIVAVSTLIRESGHPIVGGWLGTSSPLVIEACRAAGLDFVTLDTQHGALSLEDCAALLARQAQEDFSVIVRVDSNEPAKIGKALDLGASGVIVPLVETAEQARSAAQACRFPPLGVRSYGPVRSDIVGMSPAELNDRARLFVMIETEVGMRNAAEIAATPGVDGIFIGPADLSISLGLAPQRAFDTAQLETHFRGLRLLADRHGLMLGSLGLDVESATRWIEYGCDFVAIVTDERRLIGDAMERLSGDLGVRSNVEG